MNSDNQEAGGGEENPHTILRARIALLATALGGPDYTSTLDPPPYKLGDDCLACLKDLKRWFKLVDDQQNTWEVAMAAGEYKILTDDLIPILIDWETKSSLEAKLRKKNPTIEQPNVMRNKIYYDKVALHCLQLLVLMTWPLILTDQSSSNQVNYYTDLKKYQLVYKKAILSTEKGKVLKAINRLVTNVMKIDRLSRTPRDNMIIKLALNFFRNLIAIEPGEVMITSKKKPSATKGLSSMDTLSPNVSMDDISLNTVVNCFHKNKVLTLILTLSNLLTTEFDQDFINMPILEIMFYLTKDTNQKLLFQRVHESSHGNDPSDTTGGYKVYSSVPEMQLKDLLQKELQMKKHLIKNTSSRHSRFGAMLSIQTDDQTRLTVSGAQNILNDSTALDKLDNSKKWNKRITRTRDDPLEEGLPNSLLNAQGSFLLLQGHTIEIFTKFINNFIDSSFNIILHSVTNYMTTEQDKIVMVEQIEFLLFFAWFLKYQILRSGINKDADMAPVSEALRETSFILVSHLLRTAFEMNNWIVVHAAMIAFNELLILVNNEKNNEADLDDIEFILSRLFSDERIQLLSNLPKTAGKHTPQYMMSCIDLTHTVLKTLEQYATDGHKLVVAGKPRRKKSLNFTEVDIQRVMEEDRVDRDEAIDILTPHQTEMEVDFEKVQNSYINDFTIETYITFLGRFRELENDQIKKIIAFFHRVLIQAKEEAYLFRLDLIVLFRDMLSDNGIEKTARVRKHVEQFSNYYLQRLKSRVKKSPSWIMELLFPSIHDAELSYYQRYGEKKPNSKENEHGVPPSIFKELPDEEMLPESAVRDMKFGILVATLIDDAKSDYLDELIRHLSKSIDLFKSWLTVHVLNENETANPPNEKFSMPKEIGNPLLSDRDFRALLKLIGYEIPMSPLDSCYLPGNIEYPDLQESLELLRKYTTISFETPNGLPAASYLIRPRKDHSQIDGESDGWTGHDHYDYHDPSVVRDEDIDDDEYFKDLENGSSSHKMGGRKGIATSKKKKHPSVKSKHKSKSRYESKDNSASPSHKQQSEVYSKEYIDSDEEDEPFDPIFFENEMYLRWLLDRHGGQLSPENYNNFGKFASERFQNKGSIINDYTELFGGPVPSVSSLHSSDNVIGASANKALLHINEKIEEEVLRSVADEDNNSDNVNISAATQSNNEIEKTRLHNVNLDLPAAPPSDEEQEETLISDTEYQLSASLSKESFKRPHEDESSDDKNDEDGLSVRKSKVRKVALSDDEDDKQFNS